MSDRDNDLRGLWLWLEPVAWSLAVAIVALPRMWEAALGDLSSEPGVLSEEIVARTTDPAIARRMSVLLGGVLALWAAVRFL